MKSIKINLSCNKKLVFYYKSHRQNFCYMAEIYKNKKEDSRTERLIEVFI